MVNGTMSSIPGRQSSCTCYLLTRSNFALNIQGVFGRSVTLEVSTDLTNWQTLTNLTSTNTVIYFEDSGVTNSGSRFYRAVVP